jgi:enoyl-CoA hydratase/carnithine racemase
MMSEYQNWLLTEEAHIATLTLNRPEAMNSLTAETLYELRDITAYLRTGKRCLGGHCSRPGQALFNWHGRQRN